ncbi:DUF1014-domain-containing protein [Daldinia decipiens]|uniref:DUF1014-domain-containing protein n=1 Tax=Daldinia decipiens TaxID=326647 RepID=UPI0020C24149|nr:DUF1014-domain-containing protein [Daldinia decipiens]KAI1658541.1 DUF1014-domain-containing protein [Daldinia decipiens]
MAGKGGDDGSKKAAGQARKAQTAANKAAAEKAKKAAEEAADWDRGAKNNAKKEAQEAKEAEQARKKAEKKALAAEEEKSLPTRPGPKNSKTAVKKTNQGHIMFQAGLEENNNKGVPTRGGSGINAALRETEWVEERTNAAKADRNPSRRVKAAFEAFKEKREREMKDEGTQLNFSQRKEKIKNEFEKSEENPRNNTTNVRYNATKEEIAALKQNELDRIEGRYDDSE